MLRVIRRWVEHRRAIRRRWQADARILVAVDEVAVYYEAQRRAVRAPRWTWPSCAPSRPRRSGEGADSRGSCRLRACGRQGKLRRGPHL